MSNLNVDQFEKVFKKNIKTSSYSISIKALLSERLLRKINYSPYYQRNYVWDTAKASFFIESILLGTDVPPLIFFNSGSSIEVVDGRQRFETIKNFFNGDLKLNIKGLTKLTQLKNQNITKLDDKIKDIFSDAKIRVFEFEVVNEPKLDSALEDKIKKEIFRRYNSGITPLNSAEIDNASYDDDEITRNLKKLVAEDTNLTKLIVARFLGKDESDMSKVLQFLRKHIVLSNFPIRTYAMGSSRSEILELLYNVASNNTQDVNVLCNDLILNIRETDELIKSLSIGNLGDNRFLTECLLWVLSILKNESISVQQYLDNKNLELLSKFLVKNKKDFIADQSHYYASIISRYTSISEIFSILTGYNFKNYLKDDGFKEKVKELRQTKEEAKLKLEELSSLRVQKPEPSLIPVDQIIEDLITNRYMIRPTYQRQERINIDKSSAIIESMILGISLPPIFIFKNNDRVREVIDGQQRLLSILGFIGKQFQNESGRLSYSKNHKYKLRKLKIMKELNGSSYDDLDIVLQDKILDFRLSIIEIDSDLNKNFDPVDLFIRLNNKPYPIKENSFEMWNSFIDREIITLIKDVTDEYVEWFYIKKRENARVQDRMLNEELITLLSYIEYNEKNRNDYKSLGFYLRDSRINCRIVDKKDVSIILEKMFTDVKSKNLFLDAIRKIKHDIQFLEKILDSNLDKKNSLDILLNREDVAHKRFLVDFYMLFHILRTVRDQNVSFIDLKTMMKKVQQELNSPPISKNISYQEYFSDLIITTVAYKIN